MRQGLCDGTMSVRLFIRRSVCLSVCPICDLSTAVIFYGRYAANFHTYYY